MTITETSVESTRVYPNVVNTGDLFLISVGVSEDPMTWGQVAAFTWLQIKNTKVW